MLNEGFHTKWEASSKLEPYIRRLSDAVATFRDKVDELLTKHEKIVQCLEGLSTCPINGPALQKIISRLQEAVDELNLAGYSNLEAWVRRLDKQLETILTERLLQALEAWLATFSTGPTAVADTPQITDTSASENQMVSPRKVTSPLLVSIA